MKVRESPEQKKAIHRQEILSQNKVEGNDQHTRLLSELHISTEAYMYSTFTYRHVHTNIYLQYLTVLSMYLGTEVISNFSSIINR